MTIEVIMNSIADIVTNVTLNNVVLTTEKIELHIVCSDEITDLTIGTTKTTFRVPCDIILTEVRANVNTAPIGSDIVVDINKNGTSILSTKLNIDDSSKTSVSSNTPAVISNLTLLSDDEITIDIDQVGSTIAGKGLKVWLIGSRV